MVYKTENPCHCIDKKPGQRNYLFKDRIINYVMYYPANEWVELDRDYYTRGLVNSCYFLSSSYSNILVQILSFSYVFLVF
jgi:hypothetical protein